ncbi:flippase-like domain-containing protein [Beggiatoa alba]|nr:flippase-like domain-containing protein [Beggiatoa alba]
MHLSFESCTFKRFFLENKRFLSLGLIFVCILYIGLILFAEPEKILAAFSKMSLLSWFMVLSCSLSNYILRFIRWHYYLGYLNHQIPSVQNFFYYMAGFALTITPAKVGETIRSTYLAQHAVPYSRSLAMFFTERFLDLLVIVLFSLFILQLGFQSNAQNFNHFILVSVIVIVSFIPLLRQTFVTQCLNTICKKISWHRLQALLQHLVHLLHTASALFAHKPIFTGLFLGVPAWLIQGIAFYLILTTLKIDITLQQSIGIYAISLLAGALSFIPGGIGTTEAVMTLLLTFLGADSASAIAAALISRLTTLWFAVCLGFCAAFVLSLKNSNDPKVERP